MSELSREQVDKAFLGLYQEQHIKGNIGITTTLILLQLCITQQAQELERVKFELGLRNEWASLHADDVIRLKQQLAASQARLYKYDHRTPEHTIGEWLADRQRIVDAKQVEADAQLQARCREMERELADYKADMDHAIALDDEATANLKAELAQLQATIAARDARIHDLERGLAAVLQVLQPFTEAQQARGSSGGAANHGAGT